MLTENLRAIWVAAILAGIAAAKEGAPLGIALARPAAGPCVETDQGFMVPYEQKLPESEVSFTMIPVPGGEVTMRVDPADPAAGEYTVVLEPYWVAKCEVTWGEYHQYMALEKAFARFNILRDLQTTAAEKLRPALATAPELAAVLGKTPEDADAITAPTSLYSPDVTYESGNEPNLPAVTMTPYAARQYTKWVSRILGVDYRLPSEAEWQHAARAGGAGAYGVPDETLAELVWHDENSDYVAHGVGELKPNAFGLHDMLGNVAEWVLDEPNQQRRSNWKGQKLAGLDAVVWPTKAYPRIAKGGYYDVPAADCTIDGQLLSDDEEWKIEDPNLPLSPWWYTSPPALGVGFRLIRPLAPLSAETRQQVWEYDAPEVETDVAARLKEGRGKRDSARPELPAAVEQLKSPPLRALLE